MFKSSITSNTVVFPSHRSTNAHPLKVPDFSSKAKAVNMSLLRVACEKGHTAIVSLLLRQPGIDVNDQNELGETPLSRAVYCGHEDVVQILLEFPGIDANLADKCGCTPLLTC